MQNWIHRHRGEVVFGLTLVILLLLLAIAWKHELISSLWLKNQKDSLSALGSVLTIFVLIAGTSFSYYRFFRGRTLSLRADLSIDVSIHDSGSDYFLHAITLSAKNVGTSTIWNPKPLIDLDLHSTIGQAGSRQINDWWEEPSNASADMAVPVIESTETVIFFAQQRIPKTTYAVTYRARVSSDTDHVWHTARTISNGEQKNK